MSGLSASTAYVFSVKARDAAGNTSTASSSLSVTTSASGTGGNGNTTADYTSAVIKASTTQAKISFKPTVSALYVDVHFTVNGSSQQNFRMTNVSGTWEQLVSNLSAGNVVDYWFTYEKSGPQYDSVHYTYVH